MTILLFFSIAQSQVPNQESAFSVLESSLAVHGGVKLASLRTYEEESRQRIFSNDEVVRSLTVSQKIDFSRSIFRIEIRDQGKLLRIQQFSPADAWVWTNASGLLSMPRAIAEEMKRGLNEGWQSLRFGRQRDSAELIDSGRLSLWEGRLVISKQNGTSVKYLFDKTGMLIASSSMSIQAGEIVTRYYNFRLISGVLVPFSGDIMAEKQKIADVNLINASINPDFGNPEFEKPADR